MSEDLENQPTPPTETPPTNEAPAEPPVETPEKVEAAEFTPVTADALTFEEGVEVNEAARDEFLSILNDREVSPAEQAQKLVDLQTRLAREASETSSASWEGLQTQWRDEVQADAEIGGQKLETVLTGVAKVIDQYGTPELRQVMDMTGAGNNIHVIKFLNNVAKVLNEGRPVSGNPPASAENLASRLYPSMKE